MSKKKTAASITKTQLLGEIADSEGLTRKQVSGVFDALDKITARELKSNGVIVIPGLVKIVVYSKPAKPARQGINPFTKEPMTIKAKPASKGVRARPVKNLKNMV